MRRTPGNAARAALLALIVGSPAGCGYSVRPPHDLNVRTVYVPIFRSLTFNRDLNFRLTEKLIREIELRTPYKVVTSPEGADTILEGVVRYTDKNIMVENPFNLPRHLLASVTAEVKWLDNRPSAEKKEIGPGVVVTETVNFFPELGETAQVGGYQKAIDRMARQIVGMMENPW